MLSQTEIVAAIIAVLVVILIVVYYQQIKTWWANQSAASTSTTTPSGNSPSSNSPSTTLPPISPVAAPPGQNTTERMSQTKDPTERSQNDTQRILMTQGYPADTGWSDSLAATELDPSTFENQANFVADVRQFSTGAGFTSVTDDNTNIDFTNFIGLRRPQHVPIGVSARQQPDIDQTVLQRNKDFRF
jgi:hypothetical protein